LARKLYRRFYRGAAEIAEQAQRDFDRRKNSLRLLSDLCGSAVIMTISTYSESQEGAKALEINAGSKVSSYQHMHR